MFFNKKKKLRNAILKRFYALTEADKDKIQVIAIERREYYIGYPIARYFVHYTHNCMCKKTCMFYVNELTHMVCTPEEYAERCL